jgi:hypothetical protein
MVVEPDAAGKAAGLRSLTHGKRDYGHAVKGVQDHHADLAAGRFEKTWMKNARVYIETREVSEWQELDMSIAADTDVTMTSRPDS